MGANPFSVRDSLAVIYRPRKLSDIVGNKKNVGIISGFLTKRQLVKTWLFAGASGCGKTTTARMLGMIMNCQNLEGADPCMECPSCKAALAGNHPDILEINAAGESGKVESIREVLQKIKLAPRYNFKVVIVDEAHGLTGKAKEEVLKPLEEPPANTIWILCTTEPEKLSKATYGRCLKLYWEYPTSVEMAKRLLKITKAEYPDLVANIKPHLISIVNAAGNQPRNSIALLEAVAAATIDSSQSKEDVESIIKSLVSSLGELDSAVIKFTAYLFKHKRMTPLNIIRQLEPSRAQEFLALVHRYCFYAALWYLHQVSKTKLDRSGIWGVNFMQYEALLEKPSMQIDDLDLRALKLCSASTSALEKIRTGLITNDQALVYCINEYFRS